MEKNITTANQPEVKPGFKSLETIQLIDGSFSMHEAQEVLLELINHKIGHHELKNFRWEERFGKPHSHSQKRLIELKDNRMRVTPLLEWAAKNGLQINIQSKIEIHFSK